MDGEERKIAALVAAFDQEHERAQRTITALEKIGESLRQSVEAAAHEAVTKALAEVHQEAEHAAGDSLIDGTSRAADELYPQAVGASDVARHPRVNDRR